MDRLTNRKEAEAQQESYDRRIRQGYPRNIPEERFLRLAAWESLFEDTGLTPDELPRAAELVRAEKEGKLHIGRCLECKEYEGLAVCSLIGDCGGTNFHCGWFAPRAEAEAALQKGEGGQ